MKTILATLGILTALTMSASHAAEASLVRESKRLVMDSMKDPDSTKFRNVKARDATTVCGEVNSKNSYGGYVGFKRFLVIGAVKAVVEAENDDAFQLHWASFCAPAAKATKPSEFHQKSDEDLGATVGTLAK